MKPNGEANAPLPPAPVRAPSSRDPRLDDPVFKEQLGRAALSFVGEDPDADDAWIAVINDPSLSDDARQNLIEDLNEDGLSDPQHPAAEDLHLILRRMELIEQLAPYAMDRVNYDAFTEAYKDLWNMVMGRPVQ
jgi:hypothetical protein